MIGRLSGTLVDKRPPALLLEVNGVGYELDVPMSTLYGLPAIGERVVLLTHLVVREDAHLLYGFATDAERDAFRLLIKISGIGPRIALAVLSGLSVDELARAIATQETAQITRVPGIGKKTAERLLLELKGKLAPALDQAGAGVPTDAGAEVTRALMALGYSEREAALAVRGLEAGSTVADGIRRALKSLAKG